MYPRPHFGRVDPQITQIYLLGFLWVLLHIHTLLLIPFLIFIMSPSRNSQFSDNYSSSVVEDAPLDHP